MNLIVIALMAAALRALMVTAAMAAMEAAGEQAVHPLAYSQTS